MASYQMLLSLSNKNNAMPVDLRNMPGVRVRPNPPKIARWVSVLVILIGAGVVISRLMTGNNNLWIAAGLPIAVISALLFIFFMIYAVQLIVANSHDKERERTIIREVQRGRRALQILAAECCTAHSPINTPFAMASSNLLENKDVFFPQSSWRGEENTRLSQIARPDGLNEEQHLGTLFTALLNKLALPLQQLPADTPVMVLLEHSSSLPEEKTRAFFWDAWNQAGIRQTGADLAGGGARMIDFWLDNNIKSEALLLVVSWHYAPVDTAMSAETVNALLFGNRLTQEILPPLAFLHRPEASQGTSDELEYAIQQALDWVPVEADIPEHLWLSGVVADNEEHSSLMKAISHTALKNVNQITGTHNFNDFLGDPGNAAIWLSMVAATQSIQQQPAYHLLICREQRNGKVWNMVVSPAVRAKESKA